LEILRSEWRFASTEEIKSGWSVERWKALFRRSLPANKRKTFTHLKNTTTAVPAQYKNPYINTKWHFQRHIWCVSMTSSWFQQKQFPFCV
jgi:hypothetical protein